MASPFESLSQPRDVSSVCLFYTYFHGDCSDEISSSLVTRLHESKTTARLYTSIILLLELLDVTVCCILFFSCNSHIWNSPPPSCFHSSFKKYICNVDRYLFFSKSCCLLSFLLTSLLILFN